MELYIRLDERLLRDDKIRLLIREKGYEGLGIYLALLTLIRNYKEHSYQIPLDKVSDIADWDLRIPEEKLREVIDYCSEIDLFCKNDSSFWSARRKNDLLREEETRKKQSEAGLAGINRRWSNRK